MVWEEFDDVWEEFDDVWEEFEDGVLIFPPYQGMVEGV